MKTENGSDAFIPLGDLLTTDDPVWVWDVTARRVLWANHPARLFWGVSSLDALQARRFSPRSHFASRLSHLAAPPRNLKEGTEELSVPAASGKKTVQCYLQGLQVAGGRPGFIIKALRAEADRARPPQQPRNLPRRNGIAGADADHTTLQAIARRMEKSARKRGKSGDGNVPGHRSAGKPMDAELLGIAIRELGHELGNPLNVIRGFAGWIKESAPAGSHYDRLCAYADNIAEAADLAMGVFSNFSARFVEGQGDAPKETAADISDIAERCQALVAPLASESGVKVHRRIEGDLPLLSVGNGGLQQILINLLINAIRYHKSGKIIRIAARRDKNGAVKLTVSDDGKGMSKKDIAAALGTRKARTAGRNGRSGLGLPLVRRIVEDAGGRISIDSARGKGTRITVIFPAATHAA
jgi:signal transduction histidine kinase